MDILDHAPEHNLHRYTHRLVRVGMLALREGDKDPPCDHRSTVHHGGEYGYCTTYDDVYEKTMMEVGQDRHVAIRFINRRFAQTSGEIMSSPSVPENIVLLQFEFGDRCNHVFRMQLQKAADSSAGDFCLRAVETGGVVHTLTPEMAARREHFLVDGAVEREMATCAESIIAIVEQILEKPQSRANELAALRMLNRKGCT